ncbi:MAG: arylsulfotransferase family protein [Bradymonadaceae bacterium]
MSDDPASSPERLYGTVALVGIVVLAFLAGSFTTAFETFPYPQLLKPPFEALRAVRKLPLTPTLADDVWVPARHEPGTSHPAPDASYDGYTMFSSGHADAVYLIDMEGELVHEWRKSFREAFPNHPQVADPVPPAAINFMGLHLYDDGRVLGIYDASYETPYGYGLVMLNARSEVVWRYPARTHHDVHVGSDGEVWVLEHAWRDPAREPIEGFSKKPPRVLEDFAVKLSPQGEVERRFSLVDVISDSPDREVFSRWLGRQQCHETWDVTHANSIEPIGADFAEHHDFADPGDLLVSLRTLNALMLVDPEKQSLEWIERGFWLGQHDPDPMSNGHVMLYDNLGDSGPTGFSRIVEFDPATGERIWAYRGTEANPFHERWGGSQQLLPNGNVLITEPIGARLLEVTRSGEVVWEYRSPAQATWKGRRVTSILEPATRIAPDEIDFEFNRPSPSESTLTVEKPKPVDFY